MSVDTANEGATSAPTSSASAEGSGASERFGSLAPALRNFQSWGPLAILAVLVVGFSIANSKFLTLANFQTIADQSAVLIVIVAGLTFVIIQGSIDLSVQGVMAVTSIVTALLVSNDINGNDLGYVGVIGGLAVGLAFGLLNGIVYTKLRVPSLLVTIGTWFIGLGVASSLYPSHFPKITDQTLRSWSLDQWLGVSRLVFVALAVLVFAYVLQRYTRFGRYTYAIGGGEETARLSGLNLDRYKIAAFGLAGLCAGLAGVMVSMRLGIGSVQAGEGNLFPAISAIVIGGTLLSGGRGSVLSSFVGVLILSVLTNGMVLVGIDPYIQEAVQGAIIIVAVAVATWPMRERLRVVK